MNLEKILGLAPNVTISVSATDLREFFEGLRNEEKVNEREDVLLSVTETARKLGVSKNTLWRWERERYLIPSRIGRKPVYRASEVEAILTRGK